MASAFLPGYTNDRFWGLIPPETVEQKELEKQRLDDLINKIKRREKSRTKSQDQPITVNGSNVQGDENLNRKVQHESAERKRKKDSEEYNLTEKSPHRVKRKKKNHDEIMLEVEKVSEEKSNSREIKLADEKTPHKLKKKKIKHKSIENEADFTESIKCTAEDSMDNEWEDIEKAKTTHKINKKKNKKTEKSVKHLEKTLGNLAIVETLVRKKKKRNNKESELETEKPDDEWRQKIEENREIMEMESTEENTGNSGNLKQMDQDTSLSSVDVLAEERKVRKRKMADNTTESEFSNSQNREIGGFTIIGEVSQEKREKVVRVLPDWLANPSIISVDLQDKKTLIANMPGLDSNIVENLKENGISYFFPVQRQVIPYLLDSVGLTYYRPNDICVSAPTGSGKTLAYVIPIVQAFKSRVVPCIRSLVVLPVQDLALQVYRVFQLYCKNTNLSVGLAVGQKSFADEQKSFVRAGLTGHQSLIDILVATPGRLVDHISKTDGFNLTHLRYLVIDEADRIMEENNSDWLKHVEDHVFNAKGAFRTPITALTAAQFGTYTIPFQKLLFSATLSQNPEKLQQMNLFQPKLFTSIVKRMDDEEDVQQEGGFIGKYTTPAELTEKFAIAKNSIKPLLLYCFVMCFKWKRILCFTNSVESTHRLCLLLKEMGGISVEEISSRLPATTRNMYLKKFEEGLLDMLVCSDSMARGMDISNIEHVVSYERPPYIKTYIHRVGRTARGGKEGSAIILLDKSEVHHFKKMLSDVGKTKLNQLRVSQKKLEGFEEKYVQALESMKRKLEEEVETEQFKRGKHRKTVNKKSSNSTKDEWEIRSENVA